MKRTLQQIWDWTVVSAIVFEKHLSQFSCRLRAQQHVAPLVHRAASLNGQRADSRSTAGNALTVNDNLIQPHSE